MIPFRAPAAYFREICHDQIHGTQGPQSRCRAQRRRQQGHLCGPGRELGALGRRWPALCRFCRRDRGTQYRASSPAGDGGRCAAGGSFCAHLLSRGALRIVRAAGGAAERSRPGGFRQKIPVSVLRRRGGGERHQNRALLHQALGGDRLLRRLSRTHAHDPGAHRQGHAVQAWVRTVSGRGLSRRISATLSQHHDRAGARRSGAPLPRRCGPEVGRRHPRRAGAGRGRFQRGAVRVPARAAAACATSTASC